jgi:hypothetical protein
MAYETTPAIYFAGKPGDLVRVYHLDATTISLGILLAPSKERRWCWAVALDNEISHLHQDALEVCK